MILCNDDAQADVLREAIDPDSLMLPLFLAQISQFFRFTVEMANHPISRLMLALRLPRSVAGFLSGRGK